MEPTLSITQEASAAADMDAGTVSIELDFKAFADHVPTTEHAKRAPGHGDPSVQDFADQALELAALRAELQRLARDHEILQQQLVMREARLDALRAELTSTRTQLREALRQSRTKGAVEEATLALETPLAVAQLVSLDYPGRVVVLSRDIVTVGRTRNNDICLPSTGVSRDHARLLVAGSVVTLVDASSTNGCFVNDVRVTRQRLRDGDLVRIGDRSFRFELSLTGARPQDDCAA
jgi:hypothetical protein